MLPVRSLVSIPHRYAKNKALDQKMAMSFSVSIPHRYAKNFPILTRFRHQAPEFQFLIGTLKTFLYLCLDTAHFPVSIPHRYAKN